MLPVLLVHSDGLSSGDEFLHFCHAIVLPGDLQENTTRRPFTKNTADLLYTQSEIDKQISAYLHGLIINTLGKIDVMFGTLNWHNKSGSVGNCNQNKTLVSTFRRAEELLRTAVPLKDEEKHTVHMSNTE